MSLSGEELVIDGQTVDVNITGSLTAATLVRDYEGATRLELTVYDPLMHLMKSGALTRPGKAPSRQKQFKEAAWDRFSAARLVLDGIAFRLAGAAFSYSYETRETRVIFEDELATVMRLRDEPLKVSRGADTRAEFIGRLVSGSVKRAVLPFTTKGRYFSPQAGQRQPIAEPGDEEGRTKGFPKGHKFQVKTADADAEQRRVLTEALTEADRLRSGERASLALIDTLITESECRNLTDGDADSSGAFQVQARTAASAPRPTTIIDPRTGNAHGSVTVDRPITRGPLDPRNVIECTRYFMLHGFAADSSGAIKYAADHPDAEIYEIAQAMQGSGAGRESNGQANYGPWVEQAKEILDLWGGAGSLQTIREAFEFKAGGRHNGRSETWWDASGTLAEVVRWRRFADRNRVYFLTDQWLFERQAVFVIDGEDGPAGLSDQGIISLDTSQVDIGLPQAEITIKAFLPRWGGPPGGVVLLRNLGPLDGRWLIGVNDMDLMPPDEIATLTLVRPAPVKKEPAPDTNTVQLTETRPEAGSIREAIVAAARKALDKYGPGAQNVYRYRQSRPMPDTIFPKSLEQFGPHPVIYIDCSAFVTLVYKAAGAPDPNGAGYNGSGYTGTLAANGKKTNDPQPGDLVLYGPAPTYSHVAVYIGSGKAIGIGSDPGPREHDAKYRADFAGYWTFNLGSGE